MGTLNRGVGLRQSGAAAAKRAKMKRKNIAARQSKRRNYRSSGT